MGVFVALMLAELGARLLPTPVELKDAEKMLRCDRLVGWRGKANVTSTITWQGYQHRVVRNSWGMHDNEHSPQKEEQVFRILMLGDSYIEAIEVEEQQSSHAILEETLNALATSDIRFEVINGAIHAWGPTQELMYFRSEGQSFQPDLILVFWVPANDLTNVLPNQALTVEGTDCYAPYFAICNEQFDSEPFFPVPGMQPIWKNCSTSTKLFTTLLNQLYTHSHLFQRLGPTLTKKQDRLFFSHRFAPWVINDSSDEVLDYAYQLTVNIYDQLASEGEQIGAKTAFIVIPFNQAVYSEVYPELAAALKRDLPGFEHANPTLPNQIFTNQMQNKGRLVFDMHPYFVNHLKEGGKDLHWSGDIHWNVVGNQIVAETIATWLINQKLVPIDR
jgi:hypothetical protein